MTVQVDLCLPVCALRVQYSAWELAHLCSIKVLFTLFALMTPSVEQYSSL